METTPRILVWIDRPSEYTPAVPIASQLASALDARSILLHILPPPPPASRQAEDRDLAFQLDRAERQAERALRQHEGAFPPGAVSRVVLVGEDPASELIEWLRDNPVDFVVTTAARPRSLRERLTGGAQARLLRSGLAPVIAVPPL